MRRLLVAFLFATAVLPISSAGAETGARDLPPLPPARLLAKVGAPVPEKRSFVSGLTIDPGGGYEIGVETFGGAVILVVYRETPHGEVSESAYLAKGVATPGRLQATFGQFGKISMRFRESRNRPWRGKPRNCRGSQRFVKRSGVYVGNLRFRGEGGYVAVRTHRAKGTVREVARKCLRRSHGRLYLADEPDPGEILVLLLDPDAALLASSRDGVDSVSLLALQRRDKALVEATLEESRGKLAIFRLAFGVFPKALRVNEAVTKASLELPPPFHGTGRYRAAPDGTSTWSGTLSVDFPGARKYPLTGPEWETLLEVPF